MNYVSIYGIIKSRKIARKLCFHNNYLRHQRDLVITRHIKNSTTSTDGLFSRLRLEIRLIIDEKFMTEGMPYLS